MPVMVILATVAKKIEVFHILNTLYLILVAQKLIIDYLGNFFLDFKIDF